MVCENKGLCVKVRGGGVKVFEDDGMVFWGGEWCVKMMEWCVGLGVVCEDDVMVCGGGGGV